MKPPRESKIEKAVCDYAKAQGWLCFKFVSPGHRGVPDRIFFRRGVTVFVEFKAPGRKPSKLQQSAINALTKALFAVIVVDSIEDGKQFFDLLNL